MDVARRLDAVLGELPRDARRLFERTLTALEWLPVASRALRPFSRLPEAGRRAFLERAAGGRSAMRRAVVQTVKHYACNEWASAPEVEAALGFTYGCLTADPPQHAEPLEVVSWPQVHRDHVEECDAVVIGSGAGGSAAALELAEAGLAVLILEEGGAFTRADFSGPPWHRFLRLYRAGGSTAAVGVPPIPVPLGRAVGGTTLVNAGTCFQTPDRVLQRWERDFGIDGIDPGAMAPLFERVEDLLGVRPVPEDLLGRNARTIRRGVEALGLRGAPIRRNIVGCRGCGVCVFGCPSDAKQSTHLSYLPRAQRAGAGIYAGCRAERILVEDGRVRGVVASLRDPATGEPHAQLTVRAPLVFCAAGAVHTPALLAANALGVRSGALGRHLRLHPAVGVAGLFEEEIHAWRGTLQSYAIDQWLETDDLMLEVTSSVPGVGAGSFPGIGRDAKEMAGWLPHMATLGLFVADTSSGRVAGRGERPLLLYRLNRTDTRGLVRGIGRAAEILLAAGARRVFTGVRTYPWIESRRDLEALRESAVRPGALSPAGFHPVGTARMGADPGACVADPAGEVHGVRGLYVSDASTLPGCPAVNPMLTIMALATRTARAALARAGGERS